MKAPCKGCTRRVLGCHGDCTDYLAFKASNERTKENRDKYNELLRYKREATIRAKKRTAKFR